jgi:predicted nucleic acid-binding protein
LSIDERFATVDWISEDCKRRLNTAIERLGPNFEEYLRTFLLELELILKSSTGFKIRLVVDTNAVLSEAIRLVKGGKPFLSALIESPFLDFLAPPEIIQELNRIIPKRIADSAERKVIVENVRKIVDRIKIQKQSIEFSRIRAEAIMGLTDPNDVTFIQIVL